MAPAPRDSSRRTGNYHRPKRYSRRLRHVLQTSMAWTATMPTARRPIRCRYIRHAAEESGGLDVRVVPVRLPARVQHGLRHDLAQVVDLVTGSASCSVVDDAGGGIGVLV
ncbi:hypothetical protein QR300_36120 [Streptomyces antimycoticus]|nr:hypothetical protein [Streptomyces antimycoticus]WJE02407.1 hypothetical protein QR300_36120 [Streptomyces antimycoticus]